MCRNHKNWGEIFDNKFLWQFLFVLCLFFGHAINFHFVWWVYVCVIHWTRQLPYLHAAYYYQYGSPKGCVLCWRKYILKKFIWGNKICKIVKIFSIFPSLAILLHNANFCMYAWIFFYLLFVFNFFLPSSWKIIQMIVHHRRGLNARRKTMCQWHKWWKIFMFIAKA